MELALGLFCGQLSHVLSTCPVLDACTHDSAHNGTVSFKCTGKTRNMKGLLPKKHIQTCKFVGKKSHLVNETDYNSLICT